MYIKTNIFCLIIVLLLQLHYGKAEAQTLISSDTTQLSKKVQGKNPKKAAILSAILPGAGQAYNKKYWKIPIVIGGFAGLGYWANSQNSSYKKFKQALFYRTDNDANTVDAYEGIYTIDAMRTIRNEYRRQRDLIYIYMVLLYGLNIIDATVDAHLSQFEINDKLSLNLLNQSVAISQQQYNTLGFQLTYTLKN